MPPIKRFVVTGQFVDRVNTAMINGRVVRQEPAPPPVRVRAIIANTKQSESEMRDRFAAALEAASAEA